MYKENTKILRDVRDIMLSFINGKVIKTRLGVTVIVPLGHANAVKIEYAFKDEDISKGIFNPSIFKPNSNAQEERLAIDKYVGIYASIDNIAYISNLVTSKDICNDEVEDVFNKLSNSGLHSSLRKIDGYKRSSKYYKDNYMVLVRTLLKRIKK